MRGRSSWSSKLSPIVPPSPEENLPSRVADVGPRATITASAKSGRALCGESAKKRPIVVLAGAGGEAARRASSVAPEHFARLVMADPMKRKSSGWMGSLVGPLLAAPCAKTVAAARPAWTTYPRDAAKHQRYVTLLKMRLWLAGSLFLSLGAA